MEDSRKDMLNELEEELCEIERARYVISNFASYYNGVGFANIDSLYMVVERFVDDAMQAGLDTADPKYVVMAGVQRGNIVQMGGTYIVKKIGSSISVSAISRVMSTLHELGATDADNGSYYDGWDDAISEAISILESATGLKLDS